MLFAGSAGLFLLFVAGGALVAQETPAPAARAVRADQGVTIDQAIANASAEVREYDGHLSFLGHPFLDGRLPGTRGMELAKDYVETHFIRAGLEPAHVDANGKPTFRQDFPIASELELVSESLSVGDWAPKAGREFTSLSLGGGGSVTAPAVFVGYSIERGAQDYSSYADGDDLTGKIAVMLRFEPMNEEGKSLWNERGWSARSGYRRKVDDAVKRGAVGVVVINTPGAADDRAGVLPTFKSAGAKRVDIPVMVLTTEAGHEFLRRIGPAGTSLMDLRRAADAGRIVQPLEGGAVTMNVATEEKALIGQNISGFVRGKGALANEIVVIGAHLDHLGMGEFGSRSGPGELHPGADDNASGSAAMIMLAERFVRRYAALPEGASARTILIQCYDAEESGLIGSAYYTQHPMRAIEDHMLMLNFDMIGRISERRLSVSGLGSGKGLQEFAQPHLDACPLVIVPSMGAPAASDHWPFYQAGVPVLFAICDPLHADYHTPRDTVDKINREDAVEAMKLWEQLALAAALRPERFEYQSGQEGRRPRQAGEEPQGGATPPPADAPKAETPPDAQPPRQGVRLGVRPVYADEGEGVLVEGVTPGSPAEKAGLVAGDRILKIGGEAITKDTMRTKLSEREPGDVVDVLIVRDGAEQTISVTLTAQS
jgi:hypothetical protein